MILSVCSDMETRVLSYIIYILIECISSGIIKDINQWYWQWLSLSVSSDMETHWVGTVASKSLSPQDMVRSNVQIQTQIWARNQKSIVKSTNAPSFIQTKKENAHNKSLNLRTSTLLNLGTLCDCSNLWNVLNAWTVWISKRFWLFDILNSCLNFELLKCAGGDREAARAHALPPHLHQVTDIIKCFNIYTLIVHNGCVSVCLWFLCVSINDLIPVSLCLCVMCSEEMYAKHYLGYCKMVGVDTAISLFYIYICICIDRHINIIYIIREKQNHMDRKYGVCATARW